MSWEDFESEREAKNFGSEMYKKLVIKYFQTQGYYLRKNSLFEGTLSDIVMEKSRELLWIEVKNTTVSIFARSDPIMRELFEYFYYWLINKKKFTLVIFVLKIAKKTETKRVLTSEADSSAIKNWFRENIELKLNNKISKKINNASEEDIISFFKSVSIKVCSALGLQERVSKREQIIRKGVNAYHQKILRELKSRRAPINQKSEVIINFMDLVYPEYFWQVESKYRLKKTFFRKLSKSVHQSRFPEFVVPRYESLIPVVRSFEKNLNSLRPFIIGAPYDRKTDFLNSQRKRELLYTSLRRYLWCKGLRRSGSDFFFAYENPIGENSEMIAPIEIQGTKKLKKVSIPRYKEDGTLNFVEHHSINIRLNEYDGNIGLFIWPGFLFTFNGIVRITGDFASRLHRKYLRPEWNRNLNKKSLLLFWEKFLTNDKFVREEDSWFKKFKIKPLERVLVSWTSETVNKDQSRIELFLNTEED